MEYINVGDIYVKTKQQNRRFFFNYTYIVLFNKMVYMKTKLTFFANGVYIDQPLNDKENR
jgi:hypothetical protein